MYNQFTIMFKMTLPDVYILLF